MDGIEFYCQFCLKLTLICRKCWKNQRYCSKLCSDQSRRKSQGAAQMRYARTEKGQKNQKKRDNTFRNKNTTTEHSPRAWQNTLELDPATEIGSCSRCGGKISYFVSLYQFASLSLRRIFAYTRGSS